MDLVNKLLVASLPIVPRTVIRMFASRYIAGEEVSDAVTVVRELNSGGVMATLDVLGEHITRREEAESSKVVITDLLDTIRDEKLDSNISVKLTQLGLKLDRDFCLSLMTEIAAKAGELGNFIRIDMEDSSTTDDTLYVYRQLRRKFPNVGIVLQAYLRRTMADAVSLISEKIGNFRLCKGIYIEPETIAFKSKSEINLHFLQTLEQMVRQGAYPAIATHDGELVEGASALITRYGLRREQYEFQMLLGVRPELRSQILQAGHRVRVYVPFGRQWYQYSIRRFKENPSIAGNVLKALFSRERSN